MVDCSSGTYIPERGSRPGDRTRWLAASARCAGCVGRSVSVVPLPRANRRRSVGDGQRRCVRDGTSRHARRRYERSARCDVRGPRPAREAGWARSPCSTGGELSPSTNGAVPAEAVAGHGRAVKVLRPGAVPESGPARRPIGAFDGVHPGSSGLARGDLNVAASCDDAFDKHPAGSYDPIRHRAAHDPRPEAGADRGDKHRRGMRGADVRRGPQQGVGRGVRLRCSPVRPDPARDRRCRLPSATAATATFPVQRMGAELGFEVLGLVRRRRQARRDSALPYRRRKQGSPAGDVAEAAMTPGRPRCAPRRTRQRIVSSASRAASRSGPRLLRRRGLRRNVHRRRRRRAAGRDLSRSPAHVLRRRGAAPARGLRSRLRRRPLRPGLDRALPPASPPPGALPLGRCAGRADAPGRRRDPARRSRLSPAPWAETGRLVTFPAVPVPNESFSARDARQDRNDQ